MPKFRKKPIIVEAEQWFPGKEVKGVEKSWAAPGKYYVTTIQGENVYLNHGDWVITEQDDKHYYPCADKVFMQTYEKVEEEGVRGVIARVPIRLAKILSEIPIYFGNFKVTLREPINREVKEFVYCVFECDNFYLISPGQKYPEVNVTILVDGVTGNTFAKIII